MTYVIDTHIFLWLIFDHKKISGKKIEILENPNNTLYVAAVSFWEISLKFNLGKLELKGITPEALPAIAKEMDIAIINIDANTMSSFYKLRKIKTHKDPFDRLIIWHCIQNNHILISQDKQFSQYKAFGLQYI